MSRLEEVSAVVMLGEDLHDATGTGGGDGDGHAGAGEVGAGYGGCSAAQRRVAIESLAALVSSVQAELCELVRAAVVAGDPAGDALGPVAWVAQACGLRSSSARELVAVGEALEGLPELRGRFGAGELSWDKVRAAVRIASADTDGLVASEARDHSADEVAYLAQRARARSGEDDSVAQRAQRITYRPDSSHDGGYVSAWLAGEAFARVTQVLDAEAERLASATRDPVDGAWLPVAQRRALALESLLAGAQAADRDPDRSRLVIHTDADILLGAVPGNAELNRDILVGVDALRRLACCAEVIIEIRDAVGDALGIRRASREPPRWLRRYLRRRDRTCRFPGCDLEIRQWHHLIFWGEGGPTDADNLIGLCWWHHRLVHEGGWDAVGDAERVVVFTSPDGRRCHSRTPAVDPDIRRRAARAARRRTRRHSTTGTRAGPTTGPP